MKFFSLFIYRPVATALITLAIVLCGILGFKLLPVSPLPQIDLPVISVSASLAGADPETMAATVATPLERSLGRIAGVNEMTSTSSLGNTRIILQFDLDRDINGAARDVQAALNAAQSLLPSGMISRPTYRKVNPADSPIMILALTSDTYSPGQLYDYASTELAQRILQVSGVGDVNIGGGALPAVRVALNPSALFNQGISLDAVRQAISNANIRRPKGAIESQQHHWQIQANDQLSKAEDYQPIIIHTANGASTRLQDVAEVKDSVQDVRNAGMSNAKRAILLIITRSPDANIIETVDRVHQLLPVLRETIPSSININVTMDRSPTIRASLNAAEHSMMIAIGLVILVVFIFLRSGRATLIPAVAIPVSLIGTFAVMYLCGFSLNNLSLMALIVATGFVVDDAIVVLENISRHIEAGIKPMQAALRGIQEVGFTVLSMSVSLVAVFIPLLFMGGLPGRIFREFAVTLSVSIAISLFVSLTLTPMMSAHLLRARAQQPHRVPSVKGFNRLLLRLQQGYAKTLTWALNRARWVLLVLLGTIALNVWLYIHIPKTFFPEQDTGLIMGNIQADQSISFQAMYTKFQGFMRIVHADPAVASVTGFTGASGRGRTNTGNMFITLKPLSERRETAQQVIARLRTKLANEPGANLFLMAVQDLRTGGRQSNAAYQYTLLSDDLGELNRWAPKIRQVLATLPELADVNSDQQDKGAEMGIIYDRDAMTRLGISPKDVDNLLNNAFSQRPISTIYQPLNQYRVVMEVAPAYAQDVSALNHMFVINNAGNTVPLSQFARWQPANTPLSVNHQGLSAATTIAFNLPEGGSLSQASDAIQRAMTQLGVPSSIRGTFAGTAQLFQDSANSPVILLLAAIATVYIVLGMLYESYIHPLTILSTLPSAGIGALLALELFNAPFSLIALIGILLLIGIVKKNAIMMVDFALTAQRNGDLSPRDAIFQACLLRFRPIMMTTLASIFGAIPLVLGSGNGAELRQPLGITILGGLIVSQLLTLYTTPVVYLYFDRLRSRFTRKRKTASYAINHTD